METKLDCLAKSMKNGPIELDLHLEYDVRGNKANEHHGLSRLGLRFNLHDID